MARVPQSAKPREGQRWLQALVNNFPEGLDAAISIGRIICRSPLADDDYAE